VATFVLRKEKSVGLKKEEKMGVFQFTEKVSDNEAI
jgi:hypothetical protein